MGGKQPGEEQKQEGQYRKPGVCTEGPASKISPPLGKLIGRPGHLEGICPPHPVPNHLHVAVDAVDPERDCHRAGYGYECGSKPLHSHLEMLRMGTLDILARPG